MSYLPTNRKQTKHHISVGIDGYTFMCASNTSLVNRRYGFHCRVKGLSLSLTVNPEGISRTWMWEEHVPGIQMVLIEQAAVMKFHCRVMGLSHPLAVNPVISLETAGLWANLGRKCKKSMFPEFISFDNPIRRVQSEARQYAASLTHTKLIKGFDSYLLHIFSPW